MTLIEAVISMVIVSVMLVAALRTVGSTARGRLAQSSLRRGPALARELLSEIVPTSYAEPDDTPVFGPESGETTGGTRTAFDDVDDYNGWSETTIQTKDGTALADLTGWSRSVVVQYVSLTDLDTAAGEDTGLKRIIVTVADPTGREASMSALRSSSGVYEHEPSADGTYLDSVGVELQVSSDSNVRVVSAGHPLNRIAVSEE